jgi:hypothetical protein
MNYIVTNNVERVLRNFLLYTTIKYMVVDTKYITHHVEKLLPTCRDRGSVKWIAESNMRYWQEVDTVPESRLSHIDGGDMFPRLYFGEENFCDELKRFNKIRGQELLTLTVMVEYSPEVEFSSLDLISEW